MRRVYFIKPIGMQGPIKIGCSVSPDGRRQALETWSPFPLEIVAEIEGGYRLERRFHALFGADWQGHEWFRWSPEIEAVIEQVAASTFDISKLPEPEVRKQLIHRRPWSADQRLRASYGHRVRHAERRLGRRFGVYFQHHGFRHTWREHIPAIEAFLREAAG